jgi:nucleolar GTP-binding protein
MQFPQIHKSKKTIDIILNNLKKDTSFKGIYDTFDYVSKFQLLLTNRYNDIMNGLPDYKDMNDYYLLMSKNIISEKDIEKYKNHYKKTIQIINQLSERYKRKLKKERKKEVIKQLKQEYFGRVFSAIKRLDKTNEELLNIAKEFKNIPKPNKNLFTLVLAGIPNAGKTTVLTKITEADPEINSYEFTTKSLNFGYFKIRENVLQVVDTPGIVHTDFNKMNVIEKKAVVAIKTLADVIVFIYNEKLNEKLQHEIYLSIKENNKDKKMVIFENIGKASSEYKDNIVTIKDILKKNL